MQQDVDSTRRRNAIRRIARSFIETGHNRIAGAVARGRRASLAAAARRLEFRPARPAAPFCDRSASAKWPISAVRLINIRAAPPPPPPRVVYRCFARLRCDARSLSLNAVTSDNSSSCASRRRGARACGQATKSDD